MIYKLLSTGQSLPLVPNSSQYFIVEKNSAPWYNYLKISKIIADKTIIHLNMKSKGEGIEDYQKLGSFS